MPNPKSENPRPNNNSTTGNKRKRSFKPTVPNPFSYQWKLLEEQVEEQVIHHLCRILRNLKSPSRPNKQQRINAKTLGTLSKDTATTTNINDTSSSAVKITAIGINQVTKALEDMIIEKSSSSLLSSTDTTKKEKKPVIIMICSSDLPSIAAVEHLPVMAHQLNSRTLLQKSGKITMRNNFNNESCGDIQQVYICPLRSGAEVKLASCFGIKRMAAFILPSAPTNYQDDQVVAEGEDAGKNSGTLLRDLKDVSDIILSHVEPVKLNLLNF